ncbi:MAG: vWA domain-containing protein [Nannocystales bacterium]
MGSGTPTVLRLLASLLAVGTALTAGVASGAPSQIIEVAHDVEVEFHETHATLTVRRTLETEHLNPLEAHLRIGTKHPLAATSLATRGSDGQWYRGELMDVHDAVDTYWKLTGSKKVVPEGKLPRRMPSLKPKDPALLMWRGDGLSLFVFPLSEGESRSVEYTLQVPYEHESGADVLYIPVGGVDALSPRITFSRPPPKTAVTTEGQSVKGGLVLVPTSTGELAVRLESYRSPTLSVSLASIPADQRHMARVEVVAGRELGVDPAGTHAIIVVDRSRSLGEDSFSAAQAAVQAYLGELAEVADARVQIVGFARKAEALHSDFVSASVAAADLRDAGWDQRNGSDLGAALHLAASRLEDAPRDVPRRVLVLSDTALTDAVEADALAQIESLSAVVHLVDVEGARWTSMEPAEDHPWEDEVVATGGAVWAAAVDAVDGETGEVFASWVRPQSIRDVRVNLDGEELGTTWLDSGEGTLDVELYERAPRVLRATGRVWGRTVEARATRTTKGDRAWKTTAAAYLGGGMSEAEIVDVAQRAGAVSPHTAFLALEPGASPGEAMLPDDAGSPRTVFGCRLRAGGYSGDFGRYSLTFDEEAFIRDQVTEAVTACNATHEHVSVELTTTYAEVVNVDQVDIEGQPKLVACVEEALWNVEFPPGQHRRATHIVEHDPT